MWIRLGWEEVELDDEDEDEADGTPVDITTLPAIAKDDATVKRRLEKAKRQAVSVHEASSAF